MHLLHQMAFLLLAASGTAEFATVAPFPYALTAEEVRAAAVADPGGLAATVRDLSDYPSRVPGYGSRKAAAYVRARFEAAGLTEVGELPFPVTAPVEREGSLAAAGVTVPVHGCWPNLVRTPTTPPGGLRGRLLYGRSGRMEDLKGLGIEGAVVALDYACDRHWLNAFSLGAKAVVFIEPSDSSQREHPAKFLRTPVRAPRYFISADDWARVKPAVGSGVTLTCRMDWVDTTESNILGWVRGTDAALAGEVTVLSAYYDSMSVVPALAPGADQAAGMAALLDLAEYFAKHPPPRSILFLATSGHGLFMEGATQFFDRQLRELGLKPAAFIALDLSSAGTTLGAYNVGHAYWDGFLSTRLPDLFAPVGTQLNKLAHRTALLTGVYTEEEYRGKAMEKNPLLGPFVESLTGTSLSKAGIHWGFTVPTGMVHEAEVALLFGHFGYAFVTRGAERPHVDSPLDTFDRFNPDSLAAQVRFLKPFLKEMLHTRDTRHGFITSIERIPDWQRQAHRAKLLPESGITAGVVSGRVVEFVPRKSYIPDEPKTDALAVVRRENENTYLAVRAEPIQRVRDAEVDGRRVRGQFRFPNIARGIPTYFAGRNRDIEAYVLDPATGDIVYAKDQGRNGEQAYPTRVYATTTPQRVRRTVVVFPCAAVDLYDTFDPRYLSILEEVRVLDGRTDVEPESFGTALTPESGGTDNSPGSQLYADPCAALFIHERQGTAHPFKVLGASGFLGRRMALINASEAHPTGVGFDPALESLPWMPLLAARDLCRLNGHRIGQLAEAGIVTIPAAGEGGPATPKPLLVDLQHRAEAHLARAEQAFDARDYPAYLHEARGAWALASRAYPMVLQTTRDAVFAVLFYLALLLPSAYFLERLLFGYPDIRRQLLARGAIFASVFVVLRTVNPAFRLSINPYVVLLGFVTIALTFGVLRVILRMFKTELVRLRARATGVHNVEIGRSDAAGVAFGLGISSMRKRRVRTASTLVTLVILTFSVLSFTSVVSRNTLKGRELYDAGLRPIEAPYNGVLFRSPVYAPLGRETFDYIKAEFAGARTIAPRAWYPGGQAPANTMVRVDAGARSAAVPSVLGVTPEEKEVALRDPSWLNGEWLGPEDGDAALVPQSLADILGLGEEDLGLPALTLWGRPFVLRGILADDFFNREKGFTDIDGEPLAPVNYAMSAQVFQHEVTRRADIQARKPPLALSHFDASGTIVVPFETAVRMGGSVRSIAIVSADPAGFSQTVLRDELLSKLAAGLFVGVEGRSYWYTSLGQADYKGLFSLLVLILIAALIVFNTILGSLYERQREIGIYTALGLAPGHIGSFFLAESCVYAVLGSLFGYMLGQVFGSLQTRLDLPLLAGLTLNYSSKSALYATFIVGGVVMLSSVYPAWKASRLSVPQLERSIRLPEPVDDTLRLEFPFTFSGDARIGMMAFLYRYLKDQEEIATGRLLTEGTRMEDVDGRLVLEAQVWVAPFDWGISQEVALEIRERDGQPVIEMSIRRLNGEMRSWLRVNRRFISDMRRQFLLWRTISPEDRQGYTARGRTLLNSTAAISELV